MNLITNSEQLTEFYSLLKEEKIIAIDTEFIRQNTYFPKLCLLQIATSKQIVAIDPLSKEINLDILYDIFVNENILKIFHAARQDVEIIIKLWGVIPFPIYDTQVAAMFAGLGEAVSYEKLVAKFTGNTLNKNLRYSNWAKRPLDNKYIEYALDDVAYLIEIYEKLNVIIAKKNRTSWAEEEMLNLSKISNYLPPPPEAWLKLKFKESPPLFINIIKELAKWREIKARKFDLPRQQILTDELIIKISNNAVSGYENLANIMTSFIDTEIYEEVINIIVKVRKDFCDDAKETTNLASNNNDVSIMLKLLLKVVSNNFNIPEHTIASNKDILHIAHLGTNVDFSKINFMRGWRDEIFGRQARQLLEEKLSFKIDNKKIAIFEVGVNPP